VAGVVALGISTASDEKENRETYTPTMAIGDAAITPDLSYSDRADVDWAAYRALVAQRAPAAAVTEVRGVPQDIGAGGVGWTDVTFRTPGAADDDGDLAPMSSSSSLNTGVLISDGARLPAVVERSADVDVAAARTALAAGKAVVLASQESAAGLTSVELRVETYGPDGGRPTASHVTRVPATVLVVPREATPPLLAMLPPGVAMRASVPVGTVAMELSHPDLSEQAQKDLQAALGALPVPGSVYVERGYQAVAETTIVQWVLAALGAVLMLGGTLTATFLALSDARPDRATLPAVGASPRTRRGVGAAYALVVGVVGAVLGALVGAVPGLAITYPLTAQSGGGWCDASGCTTLDGSGPYLEIPWLLIGVVVVGLPLLTALIVGLLTRSRLPMVARLG
jgi:putative ABC transport system permease protein